MEQIIQMQPPERTIYLSGDVQDSTISEACKQLLQVTRYDLECMNKYRNYEVLPIHLYIQSFGGSVADMWAIIDIIESSQTPIFTYCSGYCMSAAALIFLAGHYRIMYNHSSVMLHQITAGCIDKINDMHIRQQFLDDEHKRIIKYIKKHTKLKKKFFKKFDDNKEDVYFNAKECLKYGICDKIVDKSGIRKELLEQIDIQTAEMQEEEF